MSKITCKWRLVLSTCLLIWSFSSLFITHRLLKNDPKKGEEASELLNDIPCDHTEKKVFENTEKPKRKRHVVNGWYDFHGELLDVGEIDREGSEGFSEESTEFDMKVGVGRHDQSFNYIIYDQVSDN